MKITNFIKILTTNLFNLNLKLFNQIKIPKTIKYTLIYNNNTTQTIITITPTIKKSKLITTIKQTTKNLFSPNHLNINHQLTIKIKTIIHPKKNISKPLYLKKIKHSLSQQKNKNINIKIFPKTITKLLNYQINNLKN